jgi:glutamate synthase domain-containing protein 2
MDPSMSEETPKEAAQYIASLSKELSQLARRNGFETLSKVLDMAGMEAEQIAKADT